MAQTRSFFPHFWMFILSIASLATGGEDTVSSPEPESWALRAVRRPTIPISDRDQWSKTPIDRFIFERLETGGLQPTQDAPITTLLRRLYFDLIGLPPTPTEIDTFHHRLKSEDIDVVLSSEVDRLLNTQAYGERWGRHWLDVARFAESSGKEANISFPYAWRYRDYVIDAFTQDVPFDRFLLEQLAGDLLPYQDEQERARLLNATGFLAIGPKNLDEANAFQFLADVIDEQIDAVGRALMAHSIACARCHDHKSDPYTMEDYYALAGIFASTKTYFGTYVSPANRMGGDPLKLPTLEGQITFQPSIPAKRVQELKDQLASLKKEHEDGMKAVYKAVSEGQDASEIFTIRDALRIFWTSGGVEGQLEQVDDDGKALPLTMGVLDQPQMIDAPFLERGDINAPGPSVPRRLPSCIPIGASIEIGQEQSGRLQLAQWIAHPNHPLTARVFVNRVWHHLFGAGLVSTIDDFGATGQPPTHPELLDYLAIEFVEDQWSIKKLVRSIVLSRVYRQDSTFDTDAFRLDPENRLLWRASKRRLDAEAIRDAMLVVSDELDSDRPQGSLVARLIGDRPISLIGLDAKIVQDLDDSLHRSVYLPILRDRLPDVLAMFDFAEPSLVTGAREVTNVPVQALYLMNSSFVYARSAAFARWLSSNVDSQIEKRPSTDRDEAIIQLAFQKCFGRSPEAGEIKSARAFLTLPDDDENLKMKRLTQYCQALFASAEFRNLD